MKVLQKIIYLFLGAILLNSCAYNAMVDKEELVNTAWSNVQTQYQRRSDLIPNLVSTVKGYAAHESTTLTEVIEARSKATQITVNASELTPEKMVEYQKAQNGISQALGKLLALTENYPDLKANQNFLELQAQLEGTENRISVERRNFNLSVKEYNQFIRKFPMNLLSSIYGFERRDYFESETGSEEAPKVQF